MDHIHVNLDQPVFAPQFDLTLLQVVSMQDKEWIDGVTCVTQECDGELLYWNCSIEDARKARKSANIATGLMPLIGIGQQVHSSDFEFDGINYVASDWLNAVVTKDQFCMQKLKSSI